MPEANPDRADAPRGGETVTVGCKMPNGVILRRFVMEEYDEPVMGGGVKVMKRARQLDDTFTVAGNAVDIARLTRGEMPHQIIGGYAITPGVPKDLWDAWHKDNRDSHMVRNGLIFAHKSEASTRDQAKDGAKIKSGMEPVDPANPGMLARGVQPGERTPA